MDTKTTKLKAPQLTDQHPKTRKTVPILRLTDWETQDGSSHFPVDLLTGRRRTTPITRSKPKDAVADQAAHLIDLIWADSEPTQLPILLPTHAPTQSGERHTSYQKMICCTCGQVDHADKTTPGSIAVELSAWITAIVALGLSCPLSLVCALAIAIAYSLCRRFSTVYDCPHCNGVMIHIYTVRGRELYAIHYQNTKYRPQSK